MKKEQHDGCEGCFYEDADLGDLPCAICKGSVVSSTAEYKKRDDYYKPAEEDQNSVNHPSHYNRNDSIECIDEMVQVFGKEAVRNFCLCNVWKYRYRAGQKNGEEDLKKSDWYMKKFIELKGE